MTQKNKCYNTLVLVTFPGKIPQWNDKAYKRNETQIQTKII